MIPILYESAEKEFTTQGIGALSDAISCSVTEERNSTYELEMEYPMDGVHYSDIALNNIIMAIPSDGADKQAFRIYQITRPINGVVTVYAEHISYQLSNIPVKPFSATGVIPALNGLVENSIEDNPFTVWTDITNASDTYTQTEPASFRSRLGGVSGSIIDCFGGEYEFDMYTVKLHASRGSFKEVTVEYGKNLTDIEQEELLSNVVTGIVPFWTSNASEGEEEVMVTLPEYVVESEYAEKYPFKRTIVKDFSSDFDSQPTEDQLRAHTESYIKNNAVGEPEVSIDFDFVELSDTEEYKGLAREHIKLCDTIVVKFSKLGINQKAKVRKTEYDVLAERYTSVSIGSATNSFVKTVSEIQKETEKQTTDFASMLKNALALQKAIMDGNLGGNMVTNYANGKPAELVFGDTDDIATMQQCLRIGKEGIAISTNGYEGPFESAWTVKEGFNGKFIKAGSITGNAIASNSITVGNLDEELNEEINSIQTKSTIFYTQPVPPYNVNDLWCQGRKATSDESTADDTEVEDFVGDILICVNAKEKGEEFSDEDWTFASKYTGDYYAKLAELQAQQAQTSANQADEEAKNALEQARQAQTSADTASSQAQSAQDKADANASSITNINTKLDEQSASITSVEEKVSNAQQTADDLNKDFTDFKNGAVNDLLQRTTIDLDGIKIQAVKGSDTYLSIKNDGVRIYVNGNEDPVSAYLADYSSVAKIFTQSGKLAKHIVQEFTVDGVTGTAFFYDES